MERQYTSSRMKGILMDKNAAKNFLKEFSKIDNSIISATSTSQDVEAMRNILSLYKQTEENALSSKEKVITEGVKEFMASLTTDDCENFARSIRRLTDDIIEQRHKEENFGKETTESASNDYVVKLFEKMQENHRIISENRRIASSAYTAASEQKRKIREEQERLKRELIEKEKAEEIADKMEKAAREKISNETVEETQKRTFEVPVGDGTGATVKYEVLDVNGDRIINVENDTPGLKEDIAVSTVETVNTHETNPPKPEDILPGYLTLDKAVETLEEKRKKIVEILQNQTVLDNPAACSSFTKELVDLSGKIDLMRREINNRNYAKKESK